MDANSTRCQVDQAGHARYRAPRRLAALGLVCFSLVCPCAHAVDGCKVLLCLAAPSWRAIAQCIPPVTQVLRDLARGRAFPSCAMAGAGNTASHAWSLAPSFCPAQYTHEDVSEGTPSYSCEYVGAISITVNGVPFSRTWWAMDGSTSTEFSPAAKRQLRSWDTRFDDDFAAWLQANPPLAPVEPIGGGD